MPVAQRCWTCRACMASCRYHHRHSHLNRASRTSASTLSPTFPVGDHSVSKRKTTQCRFTFHVNKSMCLCIYTHAQSATAANVSNIDQLVSVVRQYEAEKQHIKCRAV